MITATEQLAILTAMVANMPDRPDTRTPAEVERDQWLEDLAVWRADERSTPVTDCEADRQADLYYGAVS